MKSFPSACGEKVGINSFEDYISMCSLSEWVSVPLRGKGRDQRGQARPTGAGESHSVSVPLRGKGRDQLDELEESCEVSDITVSVPLRGKGRDQRKMKEDKKYYQALVFPSPCGEKVGINRTTPSGTMLCIDTFPSPCGEKVGINNGESLKARILAALRFRPLAGKR